MAEFEFTLIVEQFDDFDDFANRVEEECDDVTVLLRNGSAHLVFTRDSPSFLDAVLSAVRAVQGSGLSVVRVEDEPLVTTTEIARRTNRSRETIRLYAVGKRGPGGFPPPLGGQLYRWPDVAAWFAANEIYPADENPHAQDVEKINHVLALRPLVATQRELVALWKDVQPA